MNKWIAAIVGLYSSLAITGCAAQQTPQKLEATAFSEKITATPGAFVLDVRTPEEFGKGHLVAAKNIDWNNSQFDQQVAQIDPSTPIFVYCLSGGRSAAAVENLSQSGFRNIYELQGGILKWRAAGLPEVTAKDAKTAGMTKQEFAAMLTSDQRVLVDFYADWCAPCKKMKPYLEEISSEMAGKVTVLRINADDNQSLMKELKLSELPVLQLYEDGKITWMHTGFIEKAAVVEQLQQR